MFHFREYYQRKCCNVHHALLSPILFQNISFFFSSSFLRCLKELGSKHPEFSQCSGKLSVIFVSFGYFEPENKTIEIMKMCNLHLNDGIWFPNGHSSWCPGVDYFWQQVREIKAGNDLFHFFPEFFIIFHNLKMLF